MTATIFCTYSILSLADNSNITSGPNYRIYSETALERETSGWQSQNQFLIGYQFKLINQLLTKVQIGASQTIIESTDLNRHSHFGAHARLLQNLISTDILKLNFLTQYQSYNSVNSNEPTYHWGITAGHFFEYEQKNWSTESYFESIFLSESKSLKPSTFARLTLNYNILHTNTYSIKLFTDFATQNEVDMVSYEYAEFRFGTSIHYSDWVSFRTWYRAWKDHSLSRLSKEELQNFGAVLTLQFEGVL